VFTIVRCRRQHREVNRIDRSQAALRCHFEQAKWFDFIAEKFNTDRLFPVRRINIENSAPMKTVLNQPAQQLVNVDRVAASQSPRLGSQRSAPRYRLQKCLDRRNDHLRRRIVHQLFQQPEPLAICLIAQDLLARPAFGNREPLDGQRAKQREIINEIVGLIAMGEDDDQRAPTMLG
jgi:hypothetical protein